MASLSNLPIISFPLLPTTQGTSETPQYTVNFTAEPEAAAPNTQVPDRPSCDKGYVPRGVHRELDDKTGWKLVPDKGKAPLDVYQDAGTFTDKKATVQIVTFYMEEEKQAKWDIPLCRPDDVRKALMKEQEPKTWRLILCEGLHGPTMKVIAKETNWALPKFARIFSWSRPSAEWADGSLLVHFVDQLTQVWMLYDEPGERNPVFIVCTKLEPNRALTKRWEDFIDFGDSRPNLLLRKDPSLMLYAMMRAIIQDLRATAFQKNEDMGAAYDLAMTQPSQKSLRYFYELQQSIIRIKLDTTSLRDAAKNLIIFVNKMRKDAKNEGKEPLVSADTCYMLQDQMGLIRLLFEELPEISRQAEAVGNLAFNSLTFSTNNLLRLLAVLTIASVPLQVATGILGINYFDADTITGEKIGIVLASVGGAVILGLLVFLVWGYNKLWQPGYRRGIEQRNAGLQSWSAIRKAQEQKFADLEAQNQRARAQSKKDSVRPDVFIPIVDASIADLTSTSRFTAAMNQVMASAQIIPTTQQPEAPRYTVTITDEPVEDAPPATLRSTSFTTYDKGFVPRGHRREPDGDGWKIVKDGGNAALDIYEDHGTFMEPNATVQIVTFYMGEDNCQLARWDRVLKDPVEIKNVLGKKQEPNTWRWVHCEGLHGPTMKAVAEGTDWSLDRFAGIFAWTRPSAEWAQGCLLVHFLDQMTHVWMLYKETENNPIFITCTKSKPNSTLKRRWEDYVDFGDSRPHLLLRNDPSLMLYGMMRAIIQDLRATSSQKLKDMSAAYDLAMSQPSQKSLRYFYELQQSLIRVKLDTTSLRDAATNLIIFVDEMHKESKEKNNKPLVSEDTRYMLRDQMGLIRLLFEELPEVTRQAEAVSNLAFNTLTFNTNNLLRLLAVLTIASVPLTIASGILGINYFSGDIVNGTTIAIALGSVAAIVIVGLVIFLAWGYNALCRPSYRRGRARRDAGLQAWSDAQKAEQRFADLEAQNHIARTHLTKKDSTRPDVYISLPATAVISAEGLGPQFVSTSPITPSSANPTRRATLAALGRFR